MIFDDVVKVERKYNKMKDGDSIIFEKIDKSDVIKTMQSCFRSFLEKKKIESNKAFAISEIFAYDLALFEEAMEEERKERFFEFVSSTFSKEFLRGKEENNLYVKILNRIGRKMKKEEKKEKLVNKNS